MNGKIHGKQIKENSIDLTKINLNGLQGVFIFGTGSYLGSYDVPNDPHVFVNKQYVDSLSAGLDPKESVYLVSVNNISNLYGEIFIDGFTATAGKRVLLVGQTNPVENGIYVVSTATWSRADDANGTPNGEVSLGNFVFVEKGNLYSGTGWVLYDTDSTSSIINVGVNTQLWTQFSGAGAFTWGDGLNNNGNNIFVDLDSNSGLTFSSGKLRIDDNIAGDGLIIYNGVLSVGAGNGITVNTNNISVNVSNGLQINNNNIEISPSIAGNGLTYSPGVLSVKGSTAIGIDSSGVYVKYDPNTISIDANGALTIISAADAILDIITGRGLTGSQLSGPTASLSVELTVNGGLTFSSLLDDAKIQVDYDTVANQLAGRGLINNGSTIDVNILKGITISSDALLSDANTIETTANLPTLNVPAGSSLQTTLNTIDNKINDILSKETIVSSHNVTGTFLKSITIPQDVLGVTFSIPSDGVPFIFINGVYLKPDSSTLSAIAYFSTDGGTTGSDKIEVGSALYINVNKLGYDLDNNDVITIQYLSK